MKASSSPEQLNGAIGVLHEFLYSKVMAIKTQFDASTKGVLPNANVYKYLTPEGAKFLKGPGPEDFDQAQYLRDASHLKQAVINHQHGWTLQDAINKMHERYYWLPVSIIEETFRAMGVK